MRKKPRRHEHLLQCSCVRWFRYMFPRYQMLLFAIPNGGNRSATEAGRLKAEGVVGGVADLFLSVPNKRFHGMYIEMKVGKNQMTTNQIAFRTYVIKQGYKHTVCRSFDQFEAEVTKYLSEK